MLFLQVVGTALVLLIVISFWCHWMGKQILHYPDKLEWCYKDLASKMSDVGWGYKEAKNYLDHHHSLSFIGKMVYYGPYDMLFKQSYSFILNYYKGLKQAGDGIDI